MRESIKEFSDLSEAPCGIVAFIDEDANQIDCVFLKVFPGSATPHEAMSL